MLKCGLLGEKLGHSYSPAIHGELGNYIYDLHEVEKTDLADFIQNGDWDGLNVTIPYKKAVIQYLDMFSDAVARTGAANTIVRRTDGKLYGDNTDVYGFKELVRFSEIDVRGCKVLVLGSGGASAAVCVALDELNVREIVVISRSGADNYDNLDRHYDADVIVNTTPLGMYPNVGCSPIDLSLFPNLCGVFDVVYNPGRTAILLQAQELNIPFINGLYMLVAQAKRSSEIFTGDLISDRVCDSIYEKLYMYTQNIVLIGMPGTGKSTIADALGQLTKREVVDSDAEITKRTGLRPSEIITRDGEKAFRDVECEVIADIGKESGLVIATGGGVICREENYDALHQNGTIIWLRRDVSMLPGENRPLSLRYGNEVLYEQRRPLYDRFADYILDIDELDPHTVAKMILDMIGSPEGLI